MPDYEGGYFALHTGATSADFRDVKVSGIATADYEANRPVDPYRPNRREEESLPFAGGTQSPTNIEVAEAIRAGAVAIAAVGAALAVAGTVLLSVKRRKRG